MEQSGYLQLPDEYSEYTVKTRPDARHVLSAKIADLKTISDIRRSEREIEDRRYNIKCAWQLRWATLIDAAQGIDRLYQEVRLIFVEKEPPYLVKIHNFMAESIEYGQLCAGIDIWLLEWIYAMQTGRFDSYDQVDRPYKMSRWFAEWLAQRLKA